MRLGRNNIFIENMHIIKCYIQQWICLIHFDIEIFEQEIIEMVFFRLIIVRIHIQVDRIQSRIIFVSISYTILSVSPLIRGFSLGKGMIWVTLFLSVILNEIFRLSNAAG